MPSIPWKPFGAAVVRPRRFPRMRRGGKRQPIPQLDEWKIVRGDTVAILAGKDKGKTGMVSDLVRTKNHVYVKGLNTHQRYFKPYDDFQGGFFPSEAPLQVSEVALLDPSDEKPTEVDYKYTEKGERVRVSARTGRIIPKPEWERRDWKTRSAVKEGEYDTLSSAASRNTFTPSLLYFHEEIMKSMNVVPTVPKTEQDRRDLMMKEITDSCGYSMEKAEIDQSNLGLYDKTVLFVMGMKDTITRPFRR